MGENFIAMIMCMSNPKVLIILNRLFPFSLHHEVKRLIGLFIIVKCGVVSGNSCFLSTDSD